MRITFLFVCFVIYSTCSGQENYNLPSKEYYKHAFIGKKDGTEKKVYRVSIENDSVSFKLNHVKMTVPYNQMVYLRVPDNTAGLAGFIIGSSVTILLAIKSVNAVKNDPNYVLRTDADVRIGFFVIGGAIVGTIIGSNFNRYNTYYLHE